MNVKLIDPLDSLYQQHPRPWSVNDNRPGFEGLVTVFDSNGRSVVCTGDMEVCSQADRELANLIGTGPDMASIIEELIGELEVWVLFAGKPGTEPVSRAAAIIADARAILTVARGELV